MDINTTPPPDPNEMVMRDLGRRQASGAKLTMAEENIAIVATAFLDSKQFGPSIRDTKPLNIDVLPENVKGMLATYAV